MISVGSELVALTILKKLSPLPILLRVYHKLLLIINSLSLISYLGSECFHYLSYFMCVDVLLTLSAYFTNLEHEILFPWHLAIYFNLCYLKINVQ